MKVSQSGKLTVEFDPDSFFANKNINITRSILILFEYILNIKFIEVDSNQDVKRVTFLNDLEENTETKLDELVNPKLKTSLTGNPVFKKYNPTKIVLVKEDNPNIYSMVEEFEITPNDETHKTLLDQIKTHLRDKPNEYINNKTFNKNKNLLRNVLDI